MLLRSRGVAAAVLFGAGAALSLTACGSNSLSKDSGSSSSQTVASATVDAALAAKLPEKVKTAKKIVVGTDASYAPSEFLAADGKTVEGFDVDLFKAVGQKFGVDVEFVPSSFDSIIAGTNTGKYDVGVSSFTINDKRKQQANMVSYYSAGTQWATAKGNPKNVSPDAACGLKVAVQTGTTQEQDDLPKKQAACKAAGKPAIVIQSYQGQDEATAAVATGKADAMLADSPVGAYAVQKSEGALMTIGDIYDSAPYGYVLPKTETDFSQAIADALKALKADGTYDKVLSKWGVQSGGISDFAVNP
ncbi:ABC transporter substrate-binding protein [Angustibacter sp. McL0619]|uniref:ABC transporter substrate-binding protein n=1 Tax=Angustibacter sp. McL0619 TaxID=3415676 RepID=UPI003CEAEAA2